MYLDTNLSQRYRLLCEDFLNTEIRIAPAYSTRVRDNIHIWPTTCSFNNAYQLLQLPVLTTKTRETAFQVLNRTEWMNNKAFKSRMRSDLFCERCGDVETTEHLLCECMHYYPLLWIRPGEIDTIPEP
jgi:hypothetical protein